MDISLKYEQDFYIWLTENARFLREKNLAKIDIEHLAEELEAMSRREKRELISRLTVLMAHLLKWEYQSIKRSKSWQNTILEQRMDIDELLEDSPSLRYEIEHKMVLAYKKAILNAENETGIDKKTFPQSCPFSIEALLDKNFLPT